jgi:hypothetical protein
MGKPSPLETAVAWRATKDPEHPYEATVGGVRWVVRLNDFPEEHLYTLLVEGAERAHFDDWPAAWKRPEEDGD